MALQARLLTSLHLFLTFLAVVIILVGYFSNNWVQATFKKSNSGVRYSSGLFTGCFQLKNNSNICSKKITYGARSSFNFEYTQSPKDFIKNLVQLQLEIAQNQLLEPELFTIDQEYFDEGDFTFTDVYTVSEPGEGTSIKLARVFILIGVFFILFSAVLNFFLSCVYSVRSTKVFIGIYIFGSIILTTGSSIIYFALAIDSTIPNPEIDISISLGMVLQIVGVVLLIALCSLLSVTLITSEKAKVKNIQKVATLINRATMMTLGQTQNPLGMSTMGMGPIGQGMQTNMGTMGMTQPNLIQNLR